MIFKLGKNLKSLIFIQIIYNCIVKFLVIDLHFPSFLNYISDVITIFLIINLIKNCNFKIKKIPSLMFILLLFIINVVSFILDFSSPLLFLWGFRNIYRFFLFFYCSVILLEYDDIFKIFEILEKILIINFIVCAFEFFIRNIDYDFLGGLFGNGIEGGNAPLNILMIIVCCYVVILYFYKEKPLYEVIVISVLCFFIAIVAEMKIFFFEYIILLSCVMILIKKSIKTMLFMTFISIIVIFAATMYGKMYSNNINFLSFDFIKDYAFERTYGGATDINRLSAISIINERIFKDNLKYKWIGLGMGNAETSSFSFLNSNFYNLYGERVKYNWFSHAFMYVESGYLGLICYVYFFVKIFIDSIKRNNMLFNISSFISVICIIMIIYNNTLRVESMGYALFALLSIPYIKKKRRYYGRKKFSNSNNELWK